jgi:putative transposase
VEVLHDDSFAPAVLRCDNGPELACRAMADFAAGRVGLHFIPPGEPWRNGYVESFNSRVRDECLDINSFLVPGPRPSGHRRLETRLQPPPPLGPRLSTEPPARYAATCTHPSTALVLVDQFTGSDHGDRAKGSIVLDLSCQLPRTRPVGSSRRI